MYPFQLDDAGRYRCLAVNKFGVAEADSVLTVLAPPRFVEKPRDVLVQSGSLLTLDCSAQGQPQPLLTWTRLDQGTMEQSDRFAFFSNGTLRILVAEASDEGVYRCEAVNKAGAIAADAGVKVSGGFECRD